MTEHKDAQPLDYRDGRQDLRPLASRIGEAFGGALIGFATVSFLLVIWGVTNTDFRPYAAPPAPPPPPLPFRWKGPLLFSAAVLSVLGLSALAIYRRRERWRWLAAGILLGIGVTALGEGLCFGLTYGR